MLFGTSGIARGASTPFELDTSQTMQDLYLAFITDGPAGLEAKGWHAYAPDGTVAEFGKGDTVVGSLPMEGFDGICDGINPVAGSLPPI